MTLTIKLVRDMMVLNARVGPTVQPVERKQTDRHMAATENIASSTNAGGNNLMTTGNPT